MPEDALMRDRNRGRHKVGCELRGGVTGQVDSKAMARRLRTECLTVSVQADNGERGRSESRQCLKGPMDLGSILHETYVRPVH
jgi:hypothetical protein